jgi:hypothetical protein
MCAFRKTLAGSEKLAKKVEGHRLVGVVPAFHGHAHNRKCQVHWHPMYIEGAGMEDFEECERTFCLSNELANCTRLATPFHRRQEIVEHFQFHDKDKETNIGELHPPSLLPIAHQLNRFSGRWFFNKYRHALDRIKYDEPQLRTALYSLKVTEQDLENYLDEERAYLEAAPKDSDDGAHILEYIRLIDKLHAAE